jgi:hypothetical protein
MPYNVIIRYMDDKVETCFSTDSPTSDEKELRILELSGVTRSIIRDRRFPLCNIRVYEVERL